MVDDVLIPSLRKRRRVPPKSRSLSKFMMVVFLLLIILAGIFSFADIGGNMILSYAKNYLSENFGLILNAKSVTGNPVRGYTLKEFQLADNKGKEIFSAGYLSGSMNFSALLRGKIRLSEISLGKMSLDIDKLIETASNIELPAAAHKKDTPVFSAVPAYAEDLIEMPEIPVDILSIRESHFTSKFGILDINKIIAYPEKFDADVDAIFNGVPMKGSIDMGESAGLTAVNRAEIMLGVGKILATGGMINNALDVHAMAENLNLKEIAALIPDYMRAEDYDGSANLNLDITGKLEEPKILGAFNYKGTKIYGYPFERMSANINYSNYRFSIGNIQANAFNIPIQGDIGIANRPYEKISVLVRLDGSEANLEGLDKILNVPELKGLSGKVEDFQANINGYIDELNGLVHFTAPRIAYDGRAFTNIRAQLKLAKSDKAILEGKFNFEGAQGYLQGSVASVLEKPDMNITAKIVDLDVKRVENLIPDASDYKLSGKITASVNVKGSANNPVISGSVNSPEFSGLGEKIMKPEINFSFAKKTLNINKTTGTLNGMPINLNGTIAPLPSSNPNLNINATITMSPASLKNYVPDINQYALKGNINAGIKIQGNVNNPLINLLVSSPNLQAMNMINAHNVEITTALNGDLAKLEKLSLNAKAGSITANGITFTDANAKLDKNGDKFTLSNLSAQSGAGKITGTGTGSITGKTPLNLDFNFKYLALAPLAAASGLDLNGNLSGALKISGANENPDIKFNAQIPALNAMGFKLSNMNADISGNMKQLKLNKFTTEVEGGEISASGNINITPAVKADININGNNIKLEGLLSENETLKGNLSGMANLAFNLTFANNNLVGKGALTSQAVKAYGINITNINLPLSYSANKFSSNNGTAKLYGGNAKNNLTFDVNNMTFTENIEASGVDINGLIQDVSGGLEGKITGSGKLSMKITGRTKDKVSYTGSGNFSLGSGAITGFKWLNIITKLHNSNGIRYANVNAPLTLQTGKLIVRSGSIANANNNDPIYKYAKLTQDGAINFSGEDITMNFMTESSVNYQLINAIEGGGKGALEALFKGGTSGFQDGLRAFLYGGIQGANALAATGDFRTVTLRISGPAVSPSFSSLKIGPSSLKAQTPAATTVNAAKNSTPQKTQTQPQKAKEPEKLSDRIINRAVEAVLPPVTAKNQNNNISADTNVNKKDAAQDIADKLKEEITNGIKKGLGGLFKR